MNRLLCTCLLAILAAAFMVVSLLAVYLPVVVADDEGSAHFTSSSSYLHFCRSAPFNFSDKVSGYKCKGPAYDSFTERMMQYVEAKNSSTWGRREFPLPANVSVFVIGNSHTRQMYQSLQCQYSSKIGRTKDHPDPYGRSRSIPTTLYLKNNSTLVVASNMPFTYHKDKWVQTLENLLERPLSSFDAVVMGRFNGFENHSNFGKDLYNFSLNHPELFDSSFSTPTVEKLAQVYQGPIVAVPMFAAYGQDVRSNAERTAEYWQAKENRTNIQVVYARQHIEALGEECGSDALYEVGDCMHTVEDNHGGRNPRDMHRCTGEKGGHPDLVAWDLIEHLYQLLE